MDTKISISVRGPILSGSAFETLLKCGKKYCRCAQDPQQRHKVYQWSGNINGKNTTRTLTKQMYLECKKRINNYKKFKQLFMDKVNNALEHAPWLEK
ncbi:MAG: hypothetical protein JW795_01070 [Chitinivibrionales bacterium]|nr:hypothetical protein [Chitinivibrionales bacterium]